MHLTFLIFPTLISISLPHHQYPPPHPLSGHGKTPNFTPSVMPAIESEKEVRLIDLMMGGEDISLPNTWESKPKYRYPYYDQKGKGFLLYGYGGRKLYEYSEFDILEGYY
eukprot:GFUD01016693.1.p1 GENE.GFUD01016693.1~~GFUD01016693.1.p1  ORF type:complete len:110 (-),score=32.36 GFUD01016693.1:135-464(-)